MKNKPIFLFIIGEDSYFLSHRLPAAKAAVKAGFNVVVLATNTGRSEEIERLGIGFISAKTKRGDRGIFKIISAIQEYKFVNKKIKPKVIQHVGIKNVLLGMAACLFDSKPAVVNAINGTGFLFANNDKKTLLYRSVVMFLLLVLSWLRESTFLFQNQYDLNTFKNWKIHWKQTLLVSGSGVDVDKFCLTSLPNLQPKIVIGIACRLLNTKGIREAVSAMEILSKRNINVHLMIAGSMDLANPASLNQRDLNRINKCENIELLGYIHDIKTFWSKCHIGALLSYGGEGIPMSLMQPASMGRPLIATNVAGNRSVISDNISGYIVAPKEPEEFADAVEKMCAKPEKLTDMGLQSHQLIHEKGLTNKDITNCLLPLYAAFL